MPALNLQYHRVTFVEICSHFYNNSRRLEYVRSVESCHELDRTSPFCSGEYTAMMYIATSITVAVLVQITVQLGIRRPVNPAVLSLLFGHAT